MAVQAAATGQPAKADLNWYSRSTDEVAAALAVDPAVGLTAARAAELLAANGPNALPEEKPKPGWRRFLEQYTTATRGAGRLLRAADTSGQGQARGRARRCSACCSNPMRPGVRPASDGAAHPACVPVQQCQIRIICATVSAGRPALSRP